MFTGMITVFLPLVFGYLFQTSNPTILKRINQLCHLMIIAILALMGFSLAGLDNLSENIIVIAKVTSVFVVVVLGLNLIGLWLMSKRILLDTESTDGKTPLRQMIFQSVKLIGYVVLGFIVAQWLPLSTSLLETVSQYLLMALLLIIGIELRNSGIGLKQILLNRTGLLIAITVAVTSWVGGIIAAFLLSIPVNQGLAMASGFGWYTLAGILIGDIYGPVYGGVAFINELVRELVALILIPLLITNRPVPAIGVAGATAMDFTLPVIQMNGGVRLVPIAIVSGFILSLFVPIFILFFSSM